jgi:hypothetical protein
MPVASRSLVAVSLLLSVACTPRAPRPREATMADAAAVRVETQVAPDAAAAQDADFETDARAARAGTTEPAPPDAATATPAPPDAARIPGDLPEGEAGTQADAEREAGTPEQTLQGSFSAAGVSETARLRVVEVERVCVGSQGGCLTGQGWDSVTLRAEIVLDDASGASSGPFELDRRSHDYESSVAWRLLDVIPLGPGGRQGVAVARIFEDLGATPVTVLIARVDRDGLEVLWSDEVPNREAALERAVDVRIEPGVPGSGEVVLVIRTGEGEGAEFDMEPEEWRRKLVYRRGRFVER